MLRLVGGPNVNTLLLTSFERSYSRARLRHVR